MIFKICVKHATSYFMNFFFTGSSSEEESGEEEESGSGTDQDGSGDTASEPGSQHTTPDNVSGEEIEHGEIVSSGDKHVERIEEGEEVSGDDEDTKNGESLEGSLSGQDRRSNNAERRSRHKKKHKQKTRFVKSILSILRYFTMMTIMNAKGSSCTFISFLAE